jgi:hypothetical protein
MAKKRKATRKRRTPNPAAPKFKTGVMVPVRGVRVNKRGVLQAVIIEDENMGKALKRGKR